METTTDFIFLGSKITVDGDCSHEMKRRLLLGRRAFQEIYGLPITGETDFATHRSIGEAYKKRLRELERRPGSPDFDRLEGGVISPGDRFDGVTALQLLFNSVAEQDDRFAVEISGVYGDSTLVAVKLFDALRGRDGDGKVDRVFWNELQDFSSRFSEN